VDGAEGERVVLDAGLEVREVHRSIRGVEREQRGEQQDLRGQKDPHPELEAALLRLQAVVLVAQRGELIVRRGHGPPRRSWCSRTGCSRGWARPESCAWAAATASATRSCASPRDWRGPSRPT